MLWASDVTDKNLSLNDREQLSNAWEAVRSHRAQQSWIQETAAAGSPPPPPRETLGEFSPRGSAGTRWEQAVPCVLQTAWAGPHEVGGSPCAGRRLRAVWSPPGQELERLEVERVEMIRQHLCQYTQLRHETDMFNQSVSRLPWAQAGRTPRGWGWGSRGQRRAT